MATAMFIGHSFVCRYANDELSRHLGPDVEYSSPNATKLLAICTGFTKARYCKSLYTALKGINLIGNVHKNLLKSEISKIKPRFILDIGTNDLARLTGPDEAAAAAITQRTCNKAREIIKTHKSLHAVVVFCHSEQ